MEMRNSIKLGIIGLLIIIVSFSVYGLAVKTTFNPFTSKLDYIRAESIIDLNCSDGQIPKWNSSSDVNCGSDTGGTAPYSNVNEVWIYNVTSSTIGFNYTKLANNLSLYYQKTEIDTQGEMETIWGVTLATDTEVATAISNHAGSMSNISNALITTWIQTNDTAANDSMKVYVDVSISDHASSINNLTYANVSDAVGNWSKDKPNYPLSSSLPNLSNSDVVGAVGNYSAAVLVNDTDTTIDNCSTNQICTEILYWGDKTGNSTTEIRNLFTGGENISITNGVIAFNSTIASSDTTIENCSVSQSCDEIYYLGDKTGNSTTEVRGVFTSSENISYDSTNGIFSINMSITDTDTTIDNCSVSQVCDTLLYWGDKTGNSTTEIRGVFGNSDNITFDSTNGFFWINLTCEDITGDAGLCDGDDAEGSGGGSGLNFWIDDGTLISLNTSYGTKLNASLGYGNLTGVPDLYTGTQINSSCDARDALGGNCSGADCTIGFGNITGLPDYYTGTQINASCDNRDSTIENCSGASCVVTNTGTLDGYEASALLDDTTINNCSVSQVCPTVLYWGDKTGNSTTEIQGVITAVYIGGLSTDLDDTDASVEWENANDLDSAGDVVDDSHAHVYTNIDAFSEANLYTILNDVTEFIETSDSATLTTLDTGFGANELYDMDQHVLTTSDVKFAQMNLTDNLNITGNNVTDVLCFKFQNGAQICEG